MTVLFAISTNLLRHGRHINSLSPRSHPSAPANLNSRARAPVTGKGAPRPENQLNRGCEKDLEFLIRSWLTMRRPYYYILTGLFSLVAALVQLLRPASRGRGRGFPSSEMVSKAKATKGNKNKVKPRPKSRKVAVAAAAKEHPESRKVATAEEPRIPQPRIREGELDVYERMRLSGHSLLETHRRVCMKLGPIPVKLEPDRVYSYSIVARVPKSVIQQCVRPRDWYESFIPKVGDDTPPWKKPCLRDLTYNGFNAMLSPRQVEWMQKKMPGFRSAHPRLLFIQ